MQYAKIVLKRRYGVAVESERTKGERQGLPLLPLAARRSLRDEVYERLRAAILAGDLASGTRIVPEEVARTMGVSRTPVVQALDRLAREALLETLPNGRMVVRGVSHDTAREMLEIRTALEAFAGRLAAQRGPDPHTLARLRAINATMEREADQLGSLSGARRARLVERIVALNQDLHHSINLASGNSRLVRLLDETLDWTATQPVLLASSDQELRDAVAQHAAVIEALARGDADAAENALREHLSGPMLNALARVSRPGAR
jgi:DNA-binding GntR family transcriptional regulator